MTMNSWDISALQAQRIELQNNNVRARDAARRMGVSEAQYVALGTADEVCALNHQFANLIEQLGQVGELMALTRNDGIVFEHHGVYQHCSYQRKTMIVQGVGIDLRLRLSTWAHGFKVNEKGRISLQFFNAYGQAVHKIYVSDRTHVALFHSIVSEYVIPLPSLDLGIKPPPKKAAPQASKLLDVPALRIDWFRLEDTRHFEALLKAYKLTRPLAYQQLPESAEPLSVNTLKPLLMAISQQQLDVMLLVFNTGAVQVHNGQLHKLLETGPWFNVLDEKFNLHAQLDTVATAWCLHKAFESKTVGSVEFFDEYHQLLLSISLHPDARDNKKQRDDWKSILKHLPRLKEEAK